MSTWVRVDGGSMLREFLALFHFTWIRLRQFRDPVLNLTSQAPGLT